ncbi:hypothetical protein [Streptomyces sp. NPDC047123]|uniref:hypothetical protein n=1 Tax=Streptomyces sp. NPDC047123 TaxID=3155622 RepID=UPI0033C0EDB0
MRRGVRNVLGAGAAVVCLGGVLAACGGDSGDGYVATGAAGGPPRQAVGGAVRPTDDVKLVPLDGAGGSAGKDGAKDGRGGSSGAAAGAGAGAGGRGGSEGKPSADRPGSGSSASSAPSGGGGAERGRTEGGSGTPAPPGRTPGRDAPPGSQQPSPRPPERPSGPAVLSVGEPEREAADKRWCENVTVTFRNTGGSPVRSGTVTFETHIIGALGVDWATVKSRVPLPAPIAGGEKRVRTWSVCVEAWRVPLGMHVDTQRVVADWR